MSGAAPNTSGRKHENKVKEYIINPEPTRQLIIHATADEQFTRLHVDLAEQFLKQQKENHNKKKKILIELTKPRLAGDYILEQCDVPRIPRECIIHMKDKAGVTGNPTDLQITLDHMSLNISLKHGSKEVKSPRWSCIPSNLCPEVIPETNTLEKQLDSIITSFKQAHRTTALVRNIPNQIKKDTLYLPFTDLLAKFVWNNKDVNPKKFARFIRGNVGHTVLTSNSSNGSLSVEQIVPYQECKIVRVDLICESTFRVVFEADGNLVGFKWRVRE